MAGRNATPFVAAVNEDGREAPTRGLTGGDARRTVAAPTPKIGLGFDDTGLQLRLQTVETCERNPLTVDVDREALDGDRDDRRTRVGNKYREMDVTFADLTVRSSAWRDLRQTFQRGSMCRSKRKPKKAKQRTGSSPQVRGVVSSSGTFKLQ